MQLQVINDASLVDTEITIASVIGSLQNVMASGEQPLAKCREPGLSFARRRVETSAAFRVRSFLYVVDRRAHPM